jgi:hypothetical protein
MTGQRCCLIQINAAAVVFGIVRTFAEGLVAEELAGFCDG